MKKKRFFLIASLVVIMVSAQETPKSPIYNFKKLVALSTADQAQQTQLKNALQLRKGNIGNANKDTRRLTNKTYFETLETIFTEPQKQAIFKSMVDKEEVKNRVKKSLTTSFYNLPKAYKPILRKKLKSIYTDILTYNVRYPYHETLKMSFKEEKKEALNALISQEKRDLKKSNGLWDKRASKCTGLNNGLKKPFVRYHFLIEKKADNAISNQLKNVSNDSTLIKAIKKLSSCDAEYYVKTINHAQKQDSTTKQFVYKKFKQLFKKEFEKQLANLNPLKLDYNKLQLWDLAAKLVKEKKEEKSVEKKIKAYDSFVAKGVKSGLATDKIEQLWQLIEQRNTDLAAFRESKKDTGDNFDLVENQDVKTPQTIKKEFQQAVTELITLKEYSGLLGHELMPKAKKQAKEQLKEILKIHELNDGQKKAVYKKIKSYYFNKAINRAYYKYDKKKQKQKLSVLKFYFEKEYKALMASYNIDIEKVAKKTDSKYEW